MKIIPTILAHNKKEFSEKFNKLVPVAKNIQIDLMDGKFVKGNSISIKEIPNLNSYKNNFEVHLMIKSPEKYLSQLKEKGFKKIIFHVETKSPEKTIEKIKSLQMIPYLALNPETPTEKTFPYLSKIKGVLFLGVHPGKEHQKFIPEVLKKIRQLKSVNKSVKIQVDGGITPQIALKLKKAKVDYINSGSFVLEAENPKGALTKLRKATNL